MKMSKLSYFLEFIIFTPLILLAAFVAFRTSGPLQAMAWTMIFGFGLAAWTFIEYLLHRVLFHHAPILSRIHELHHEFPNELIGTPAWASLIIGLIAIAMPSYAALGLDLGTAPTAGLFTGYLWYVFVHYATHHRQPRQDCYLYRARMRHMLHHYRSHNGNFGVTTGIWDRIFGTAVEERHMRETTKHA